MYGLGFRVSGDSGAANTRKQQKPLLAQAVGDFPVPKAENGI